MIFFFPHSPSISKLNLTASSNLRLPARTARPRPRPGESPAAQLGAHVAARHRRTTAPSMPRDGAVQPTQRGVGQPHTTAAASRRSAPLCRSPPKPRSVQTPPHGRPIRSDPVRSGPARRRPRPAQKPFPQKQPTAWRLDRPPPRPVPSRDGTDHQLRCGTAPRRPKPSPAWPDHFRPQ